MYAGLAGHPVYLSLAVLSLEKHLSLRPADCTKSFAPEGADKLWYSKKGIQILQSII